jgi:hypothetical protein
MSELRINLNKIKKSSFRITNIPVIILTFFLTLQSFYYIEINLSIFPVVGTIGLFLLAISAYLNRVDKKILFKFTIFFLFVIFLNFLIVIFDLLLMHNRNIIFSSLNNLIAMFSVFLIFHRDKDKLYQVLVSVVALHLFFFYLQVAVWFTTSYFIDYVFFLSDSNSVFLSSKGIVLFDQRIPRFTGLFNEPSTYATFFFSIFSLYYLIKPRVNWFFMLAFLSLFITMSILGIILAFSFVLLVFFKTSRKFRPNKFIYLIMIIVLLFFIEKNYNRFLGDHLELDYRLSAINNILNPLTFLFGKISGQACGESEVDITFITTLMCHGGMFYVSVLLAVLFFSRTFSSFTFFVFVSMILISKVKLTYPVFWIYITVIFILSNFVSRPVNKDLLRGYSKTSD